MKATWDWDDEVALWKKKTMIHKKGGLTMPREEKTCQDEERYQDDRNHFNEDDRPRRCVDIDTCERNICKAFEISVPFTIIPRGEPKQAHAVCKGNVMVDHGRRCCENKNKHFDFTATQIINVEIPIEFGAEICFHRTCVEDVVA
jgi:hypothetical protein